MKHFLLPSGSLPQSLPVLRGKDYHYLVRVRRMVLGDRLAVATPEGLSFVCKIVLITPEDLHLEASDETLVQEMAVHPPLILYPFLLKSGKMEDVIRQACEAGATRIQPVLGDHSVFRIHDEVSAQKKLERWKLIAKEASQQSGSAALTTILPPIGSDLLPPVVSGEEIVLFFHETPLAKTSLHQYLHKKLTSVSLIIGPEGGLSPREVDLFLKRGYCPVHLGSGVLRAETASIFALGAVRVILQESNQWCIPN